METVDKEEQTATANSVEVKWHVGQNGFWWNETCAMVLEVFGLPGDRFTSHPSQDKLIFNFKNPKDASLCRILLSDRL